MAVNTCSVAASIYNTCKQKIIKLLSGPNPLTDKHYLTWITHNVVYITLVWFPLTHLFSCLFFRRFHFSLIFVLTWGITMKIRRSGPFCAIPVIADAIHICLQNCFNPNYYILTFSQFVCLFVFFFFLLRLIFRFNKFVIFQTFYSFLWLVFMAK